MKKCRIICVSTALVLCALHGFAQRGRYYGGRHHSYFSPGVSLIGALPFGAVSVTFGGNPYHYYNGLYYRPYLTGYSIVPPPVGIIVPSLPYGSVAIVIDSRHYYRFQTIYYSPLPNNTYQVVAAPGSDTPAIANDKEEYEKILIEGKVYYKNAGKYYKAKLSEEGEVVYEEIGNTIKIKT